MARDRKTQVDRPGDVLVVSSDLADHEILASFLRAGGFGTQHASDYDEAAKAIRQSPVVTILCAEEYTGGKWQDLQRLADRVVPPPVVVVLVRFAQSARWAKLLEAGAFDVLPRPIDPGELFQIIGLAEKEWERGGRMQTARPPVAGAAAYSA